MNCLSQCVITFLSPKPFLHIFNFYLSKLIVVEHFSVVSMQIACRHLGGELQCTLWEIFLSDKIQTQKSRVSQRTLGELHLGCRWEKHPRQKCRASPWTQGFRKIIHSFWRPHFQKNHAPGQAGDGSCTANQLEGPCDQEQKTRYLRIPCWFKHSLYFFTGETPPPLASRLQPPNSAWYCGWWPRALKSSAHLPGRRWLKELVRFVLLLSPLPVFSPFLCSACPACAVVTDTASCVGREWVLVLVKMGSYIILHNRSLLGGWAGPAKSSQAVKIRKNLKLQ